MANNIYVEKGYKNRKDYLKSLAEEYGISYNSVCTIAYTLGKNEDFDGLITAVEEYAGTIYYDYYDDEF